MSQGSLANHYKYRGIPTILYFSFKLLFLSFLLPSPAHVSLPQLCALCNHNWNPLAFFLPKPFRTPYFFFFSCNYHRYYLKQLISLKPYSFTIVILSWRFFCFRCYNPLPFNWPALLITHFQLIYSFPLSYL